MSTPLTHRRVLAIAAPIVLANVTVPLLGAVDTAIIGQLGAAEPTGAVGVGAIILTTLYWFFGFLRMGTSGLVAQALGAGDRTEVGAHLARALAIAFAAGLLLILTSPLLFAGAFALTPASAVVEDLARSYLAIRIWGAPATIGLYAVTGWLIATERTRAVFVLQVAQNGLNVVLSLWFVLGLDLGVPGVALGTLIAEWLGLALGLFFCRSALADRSWRSARRLLDAAMLRRTFAVSSDILVRSVVLQAMFTAFVLTSPHFGDVVLAANHVLLQFLEITAFALDGFAFAAETLVGQAFGARDRQQVNRACQLTSLWGAGGALVMAALFLAAGPYLIDLMTTAPEVRESARIYLVWAALAPILGIAAWMLDGIYIGAMATRVMRNMMLLSGAAHLVAMVVLVPLMGNHGLWCALSLSFVVRGATLYFAWPKVLRRHFV